MTIKSLIKKYKLSEYYNQAHIEQKSLECKIDPVLVVVLIHLELFNYPLFDLAEKVTLEKEVSDIIRYHNLGSIEKELLLIACLIIVLCRSGKAMDERLPTLIPYYKEYDDLIQVLKNGNLVNEISIKTNTQTFRFQDSHLIDRMLEQIANFYLSDKVEVKVYQIEYKFKGRPKQHKTTQLKKSCQLLNEYLGIKKKLLPTKPHKVSDKRRLFLADFLLSVGAISESDFKSNAKDYINSLLG